MVALENLCDRITVGHVGPMANEYIDEGIPFLRSQNVLPFRVTADGLKFISRDFHERLRKSALRPGDVVVVRTGYPGTAAVVPEWLADANCADLVIITPGPDLDAHFLATVFNSNWGIGSVAGALVGSAQQHFNVGAARRLRLHLPPRPTQRKIAAILSAYDDLIENNNRRIQVLEDMARRIYCEWFIHLRYPGYEGDGLVPSNVGQVPQGWRVGRLGDRIDVLRGRSYRGSDIVDHGGVPFINLKCVEREGGFRRDGLKRYLGDFKEQHKVRMNDIVVAVTDMTQERRIVARAARVPDLQEPFGVFSMDLVKVVSKDLPPAFLLGVLRYSAFPEQVKSYANGANVLHLHPDRIADYLLAVPPALVVGRYAELVSPLLRLSDNLDNASAVARTTRDLLIPRLIAGEVDVASLDITMPLAAA